MTAVLTISILLQLTAAGLALRMIRVTGRWRAWILIAAAILLMALRRSVAMYDWLTRDAQTSPDHVAECIALTISALFVLGLAWITPLVTSLRRADELRTLNQMRLQTLLKLSRMSEKSDQDTAEYVLDEAVKLTQSRIGLFGTVSEDETELHIHAFSKTVMKQCAVQETPMTLSLDHGGVWTEAVRQKKPVLINDYPDLTRSKRGYPRGHIAIERFLTVPVMEEGKVVAIAAVANKADAYEAHDVEQLSLLITGMWRLICEKKYKNALAESEEKYRSLVNNFQGIAYRTRNNGTPLLFEGATETITGYQEVDFLSETPKWDDIVHPIDLPGLETHRGALCSDPSHAAEFEYRIIRKDGRIRWVHEIAQCLHDEEGLPRIIQGAIYDVSGRKQTEKELDGYRNHLEELVNQRTRELEASREQLRRSERLASIGTLAAGMAHEINNPVGMILLAAENAQEVQGEPDSRHLVDDALARIIHHAQRCGRIVKSILQFSRQENTEKWPNDINRIIEQACQITRNHAEEKNASIALQLAEDLPPLTLNPIEMEQVFVNLINNAIESSRNKVHVRIRTRKANERIRIVVEDNGSGITEEQQQKLFDPFYTTRQLEGGTGLGLSIVHGIVSAHQGSIQIQSQPGFGTEIIIELPCTTNPAGGEHHVQYSHRRR